MNTEQIIKAVKTLRNHGLSNGGSLGYHAGWCDEVADQVENALALIKEQQAENERLRADGVKQSEIKWVNRPISAQYATVTDENGEKHYGKVCDRIENNPVGYCGECGKRLDDTFMNYCPNCGAKMKGE